MREFSFVFCLATVSRDVGVDLEAVEARLAAHQVDCTVSVRDGRLLARFTMQAPSLREAMNAALYDLRKAGYENVEMRVDDALTEEDKQAILSDTVKPLAIPETWVYTATGYYVPHL